MFTTFSVSSTTSTKPARACDACHSLKIKCRNLRPATESYPCEQCRCARVRCTYQNQPAKRGRPRKQNTKSCSKPMAFDKVLDLRSDREPRTSSPSPSQTTRNHDASDQQRGGVASSNPLENHDPQAKSSLFSLDASKYLEDIQVPSDGEYSRDIVPRDTQAYRFPCPELQTPEYSLDVWTTIHEFFETIYIIFPVISYVDLISQLIMEPNWSSSPHLRSLIYALRLTIATADYRTTSQNEPEVHALISQVEASRLSYNFADPPTLDAVVCSLCLFAACNVVKNHSRAFLYLSEASFLLGTFVATSQAEEQRRLRIEKVLFNAESASFPIYATKGLRRGAQRPSSEWASYYTPDESVLGNDVHSDKVATYLLYRLTQIHLAEDVDVLNDIGIESESSLKSLFGSEVFEQHRFARIQSADVFVTRQWRLSCQLIASRSNGSTAKEPTGMEVESLGLAAMSWLCHLNEGDVRIVGLGKLVGLAINICMLGGRTQCQEILHGLASVVLKEDHEGEFSLAMADLAPSMFYTTPRSIGLQDDFSTSHTTPLSIWTHLPPKSTQLNLQMSLTDLDVETQRDGGEEIDLQPLCNWDASWASCEPQN